MTLTGCITSVVLFSQKYCTHRFFFVLGSPQSFEIIGTKEMLVVLGSGATAARDVCFFFLVMPLMHSVKASVCG